MNLKGDIAILSQANAVLNESNTDLPLQISLKGSNLISGDVVAKIIEIGATSLITKHSNANMKLSLLYGNAGEIIYPSEGGSSDPIDIVGSPESEQDATFIMKDATWMDVNKQYGVLASNERRIYTGVDGRERKVVLMNVEVIEAVIDKPLIDEPLIDETVIDELVIDIPEGGGIPIWGTVLIAVGALVAIAAALLSLMCCFLCPFCLLFKKMHNKDSRIKKVKKDFEQYKIQHQTHLEQMQMLQKKNKGFDGEQIPVVEKLSDDQLMNQEKIIQSRPPFHKLIIPKEQINQNSKNPDPT
ncbi:MAG: hypothetical protein EZS28_050889, partial [Streblomastix strix]